MKRACVVIGANFGDEGKGLMTDYFCRRFSGMRPVLNVRFNGGAQAGHTVVTPNGRRHVFSHIGAGGFLDNTVTYLNRHFLVNPMLLHREAEELAGLTSQPAKLIVDADCRVTLPCDMMVNQIVEHARGSQRHGSCGVGIFETVARNSLPQYRITVKDFYLNPGSITYKMEEILQEYLPERLKALGIDTVPVEDAALLNDFHVIANYIHDLEFMLNHFEVAEESILQKYDDVVFEGAQGLLLDRSCKEYFPHLTPSNTGMKNVREMLQKYPTESTEVCYVTRSYFTRHGAGRMDSECDSELIAPGLLDITNHTNEYQGAFRYGFFDKLAFTQAVEKDMQMLSGHENVTLAVTHLDETKEKLVIKQDERQEAEAIKKLLRHTVQGLYLAEGPTHNHIHTM